jgi:hypothetical protein
MTVDFSMTVPLSTNVGTTALELSSNIPASADRRRAGSSDALKPSVCHPILIPLS